MVADQNVLGGVQVQHGAFGIQADLHLFAVLIDIVGQNEAALFHGHADHGAALRDQTVGDGYVAVMGHQGDVGTGDEQVLVELSVLLHIDDSGVAVGHDHIWIHRQPALLRGQVHGGAVGHVQFVLEGDVVLHDGGQLAFVKQIDLIHEDGFIAQVQDGFGLFLQGHHLGNGHGAAGGHFHPTAHVVAAGNVGEVDFFHVHVVGGRDNNGGLIALGDDEITRAVIGIQRVIGELHAVGHDFLQAHIAGIRGGRIGIAVLQYVGCDDGLAAVQNSQRMVGVINAVAEHHAAVAGGHAPDGAVHHHIALDQHVAFACVLIKEHVGADHGIHVEIQEFLVGRFDVQAVVAIQTDVALGFGVEAQILAGHDVVVVIVLRVAVQQVVTAAPQPDVHVLRRFDGGDVEIGAHDVAHELLVIGLAGNHVHLAVGTGLDFAGTHGHAEVQHVVFVLQHAAGIVLGLFQGDFQVGLAVIGHGGKAVPADAHVFVGGIAPHGGGSLLPFGIVGALVPVVAVAVGGDHVGAQLAPDGLIGLHGEDRLAVVGGDDVASRVLFGLGRARELGGDDLGGFIGRPVVLGGESVLHADHQAADRQVQGFGDAVAGLPVGLGGDGLDPRRIGQADQIQFDARDGSGDGHGGRLRRAVLGILRVAEAQHVHGIVVPGRTAFALELVVAQAGDQAVVQHHVEPVAHVNDQHFVLVGFRRIAVHLIQGLNRFAVHGFLGHQVTHAVLFAERAGDFLAVYGDGLVLQDGVAVFRRHAGDEGAFLAFFFLNGFRLPGLDAPVNVLIARRLVEGDHAGYDVAALVLHVAAHEAAVFGDIALGFPQEAGRSHK